MIKSLVLQRNTRTIYETPSTESLGSICIRFNYPSLRYFIIFSGTTIVICGTAILICGTTILIFGTTILIFGTVIIITRNGVRIEVAPERGYLCHAVFGLITQV